MRTFHGGDYRVNGHDAATTVSPTGLAESHAEHSIPRSGYTPKPRVVAQRRTLGCVLRNFSGGSVSFADISSDAQQHGNERYSDKQSAKAESANPRERPYE